MRLRTAAFAVELSRPLATARGEIDRRRGVLVGVEHGGPAIDADAVRGVGEATPLPGWTESLADCRAALSAAAERDDPAAALAACEERGAPAARHGLALALADARARAAGEPLSASLAGGREPAAAVRVNATLSDGPVEETVAAAEAAVARGFDCLKLKVGARPLAADLDRLRAVRSAVGDGPTLRADANGAWDRPTAERAIGALAGLGVAYVEQPLPADDVAGHADLRGRGVGVALDETLATTDPRTALDAGAADALVLKPMALGGPDRALAAAAAAREAGVDPVVTTTVDAAVARAAAVHVAAALPAAPPCGLATGDLLASDLGDDPAPASGGAVSVPSGPGNCGSRFDGRLWSASDGRRG